MMKIMFNMPAIKDPAVRYAMDELTRQINNSFEEIEKELSKLKGANKNE